jgi:predicted nucleic acid-binding protein
MILDSNTIIYICKKFELNKLFEGKVLYASIISEIEVLGFHKISEQDTQDAKNFFNSIHIFDLNREISNEAIRLRQKKNISLGDAIIAATALINDLPLVTANTADFKWIKNLELINPLS